MEGTQHADSGNKKVKIVVFSDSHNEHERLAIPDGDILVHCGDFTHKSDWEGLKPGEVTSSFIDFNKFLGTLPHPHKLVISGNHEIGLNHLKSRAIQRVLSNATYLEDSTVEVEGIKFYGTPWTSSSHMAFSASRDRLKMKWKKIPRDTDILISHLPPYGVMDLAWVGERRAKKDPCALCHRVHTAHNHWGCENLLSTVLKEVRPKVHLFGHVHDAPGHQVIDGVTFINAACEVFAFDYYPNNRRKEAVDTH